MAGPVAGCDDLNFEAYWGDDIDPADLLDNKTERSDVHVESEGYAFYGDFTFAFTEKFELTAGARYTFDEKKIASHVFDSGGALGNNFNFEFFTNGIVRNQSDWSDFTPRLAISYDVNDDVTLYATASRGYKSGGFATFGYRPARRGHHGRRRRAPGHDAGRVRPRAGRQLRDRRQDAALRQHRAAERLALPLRLHGSAARLLRHRALRRSRTSAKPAARASRSTCAGCPRALGRDHRPVAARHRDHRCHRHHRDRRLRRLRRQQPAVRARG